MRGGKIIRSSPTSKWFIVARSSDDLVNDYRKLELRVLNRFLLNSRYTDSNEALENEWRMLVANFRTECVRAQESPENTELFSRLESWRNTIDAIIRLRTQGIEDNRATPESERQRQIREEHEKRRDYWLPIRDAIHHLVENTRDHIRVSVENERRREVKVVDAVEPLPVYEPVYETLVDDESIAKYLSEIEYREDDRNKMIRQRREVERAEAASAKQYAEEQALRLAEATRVEQSVRDRRRNDELAEQLKKTEEKTSAEDKLLTSESKQVALERDRLLQIQRKKTHIEETKEKLAKAFEKYAVIEEEAKKVFPVITKRESLLETREKRKNDYNTKVDILNAEKATLTDNIKIAKGAEIKRLKDLLEINAQQAIIMRNLSVEITKNDPLIIELEEVIIAENEKIEEMKREIAEIENHLSIVSDPKYRPCHNPTCFNFGDKPCSRCKIVYYCSVACQTIDWKTGSNPHKLICTAKGGKKTKRKTTNKMKKSRRYK